MHVILCDVGLSHYHLASDKTSYLVCVYSDHKNKENSIQVCFIEKLLETRSSFLTFLIRAKLICHSFMFEADVAHPSLLLQCLDHLFCFTGKLVI